MLPVSVCMLPDLLREEDVKGRLVVVIDVLRASTTIIHALVHGASCVIPCETVGDAERTAKEFPRDEFLLGGERDSIRIDGFDLDNSPFSYPRETVSGKTIIFTTTNGTYALNKCRCADEILIGGFVNLSAVVERIQRAMKPVTLLCAGTNRQLTAEDILFAGAVCDRLFSSAEPAFQSDSVQTDMAVDFFQSRSITPSLFEVTVLQSLGGTNLSKLGLQRDIHRAIEFDRFRLVPCWNPETNSIEAFDGN